MRHAEASVMRMAGMNQQFCVKQLGQSVEMLPGTYSKGIDGAQNDPEVQLIEAAPTSPVCTQETKSDT